MSDEAKAPERRWGFLSQGGLFIPVPKQPLLLADRNFKPPADVETLFGVRHIIEEPE